MSAVFIKSSSEALLTPDRPLVNVELKLNINEDNALNNVINARELRKSLGDILNRVQQGERFTVVYRSRLVGQIVPLTKLPESVDVADEPLYRAEPVGSSTDNLDAEGYGALSHDASAETRELLERLRSRAAQHGISLGDEIRQILQHAVAAPENLGDLAVRLFSPAYDGDELVLLEREVPEPMEFPK